MKLLLRKKIAAVCRRMRMSGVLPHGSRYAAECRLNLAIQSGHGRLRIFAAQIDHLTHFASRKSLL